MPSSTLKRQRKKRKPPTRIDPIGGFFYTCLANGFSQEPWNQLKKATSSSRQCLNFIKSRHLIARNYNHWPQLYRRLAFLRYQTNSSPAETWHNRVIKLPDLYRIVWVIDRPTGSDVTLASADKHSQQTERWDTLGSRPADMDCRMVSANVGCVWICHKRYGGKCLNYTRVSPNIKK